MDLEKIKQQIHNFINNHEIDKQLVSQISKNIKTKHLIYLCYISYIYNQFVINIPDLQLKIIKQVNHIIKNELNKDYEYNKQFLKQVNEEFITYAKQHIIEENFY